MISQLYGALGHFAAMGLLRPQGFIERSAAARRVVLLGYVTTALGASSSDSRLIRVSYSSTFIQTKFPNADAGVV